MFQGEWRRHMREETVPKGMSVELIDFDNLRDESGWTPPKLLKTAHLESVDKELAATLKARI